MRILVTGGAGFIGSHIVEAYLAEGHEVAVVDNLATGRRENLPPGVPLFEADVRDPALDAVCAESRPEVVTPLAARASGKVSPPAPVFALHVNGGGMARVATACITHGVRK